MLDTIKTNLVLLLVYIYFKNISIIISIIDGITTIYYVAVLVIQSKPHGSYWNLDFHHELRQKIVLTEFEKL